MADTSVRYLKVADVDVLGTALGAGFTTDPFKLQDIDNYGIHIVWDNAAADGTFAIEASSVPTPNALASNVDGSDWAVLADTTATAASINLFSETNQVWTDRNSPFLWVRIVWIPNGASVGTGRIVMSAVNI